MTNPKNYDKLYITIEKQTFKGNKIMYKKLKLNELYRELSKEANSPVSFIANVIYTNYNRSRKVMLQGLYNIVNGGPRHYWAPCEVRFAQFSLDKIIAVNADGWEAREIEINNLKYYA